MPSAELILMIEPPPWATIRGAAARQGIAGKAASEANGRLTRATEALWREILTAMRDHGAVEVLAEVLAQGPEAVRSGMRRA